MALKQGLLSRSYITVPRRSLYVMSNGQYCAEYEVCVRFKRSDPNYQLYPVYLCGLPFTECSQGATHGIQHLKVPGQLTPFSRPPVMLALHTRNSPPTESAGQ